MYASLTQREYLGWKTYWRLEPWGPYRENLHTAILAREIRRPQQARGSAINIEQFIITAPSERLKSANESLWSVLSLAASKPKVSAANG